MECEICGKEIIGKPITTKIDGSSMKVCKDCSKFGKIQRPPATRSNTNKTRQRNHRRQSKPYSSPKRTEPNYELVEDYGKLIREKREQKKWSREDLGKKINEKVSVISKIETEHMKPDTKLAKKLERLLKIDLLEDIDSTIEDNYKSRTMQGSTIGDIAIIKKH
jgi:putative transcription factor